MTTTEIIPHGELWISYSFVEDPGHLDWQTYREILNILGNSLSSLYLWVALAAEEWSQVLKTEDEPDVRLEPATDWATFGAIVVNFAALDNADFRTSVQESVNQQMTEILGTLPVPVQLSFEYNTN